jgi:hypothetical protein
MTHGIVYQFLSVNPIGWTLLAILAVGCLLLLPVIFQAACSLANVEPPGYLYSLLLVLITLVFTVPINGVLAYLLVGSMLRELLGTTLVVAFLFVVGFILCVAISSILYILALRISIVKGFLTGLYEQLLALLAFALIYGFLFVLLSVIQIIWPLLGGKASLSPVAPRAVVVSVPL